MTLMGFDRAVEHSLGANRRNRAVPLEAYRRDDQYFVLADFQNGVLTLLVPVDESSKARRVDITSAADEKPPGAHHDGTKERDL